MTTRLSLLRHGRRGELRQRWHGCCCWNCRQHKAALPCAAPDYVEDTTAMSDRNSRGPRPRVDPRGQLLGRPRPRTALSNCALAGAAQQASSLVPEKASASGPVSSLRYGACLRSTDSTRMEDPVENCPEDKAWACIQETADVPKSFKEFVSANVDLVCSEELTDHAILAQVNGACALEDEPEEEDDDEDIAGQKVSAFEADKHLKALQSIGKEATGSGMKKAPILQTAPEAIFLQVLNRRVKVEDILYSLLMGRPIVVVGRPLSAHEVAASAKVLALFAPRRFGDFLWFEDQRFDSLDNSCLNATAVIGYVDEHRAKDFGLPSSVRGALLKQTSQRIRLLEENEALLAVISSVLADIEYVAHTWVLLTASARKTESKAFAKQKQLTNCDMAILKHYEKLMSDVHTKK
ncbi:hypothetical protein HPB49_020026 [Dermacentor silvarum]|uniref:Uncharacterized protein n=1 Tax=Dermacentor silvarum TaxID=543639 RepID=A0ACB8CB71_DERSI|nr:hypothetical protein HPB49_020026 [Dermacentor silvarum]